MFSSLLEQFLKKQLIPARITFFPLFKTPLLERRGEGDLVDHFTKKCNDRLMEELASRSEEFAGMPVREKIRTAVKLRLAMVQPYIDSWPQVRICLFTFMCIT